MVVNKMDEILQRAKAVITEEVSKVGCTVKRVLLFGSRARGDFRPDSDWDFYVVIDKDISFSQREDIASRICWRLARQGIFVDVFVQPEKIVAERKGNTGYLTYYALKEGQEI
jgi:predicted nucleotidyltransferase